MTDKAKPSKNVNGHLGHQAHEVRINKCLNTKTRNQKIPKCNNNTH